jgi:hypothetical protein
MTETIIRTLQTNVVQITIVSSDEGTVMPRHFVCVHLSTGRRDIPCRDAYHAGRVANDLYRAANDAAFETLRTMAQVLSN